MKRNIIFLVIITILFSGLLITSYINSNNDNEDNNLKKVKVAEVAHTIFYAPQYAALSQGFFEEEGLDIELILTPGVVHFESNF